MSDGLYNLLFNNNLIVLPICGAALLFVGGIGFLFLRGYQSGSASPLVRILAVILALIFGGLALLRFSQGAINIGLWVITIALILFAVGGPQLLDQLQGKRKPPSER